MTGKRPKIIFPPGKLRPMSLWSKKFATEVGVICCHFAPLTFTDWNSVPVSDKEAIYQRILVSDE